MTTPEDDHYSVDNIRKLSQAELDTLPCDEIRNFSRQQGEAVAMRVTELKVTQVLVQGPEQRVG